MKIRNGFVSNSSSSSFILTYDKTKVWTGPKEIIEGLRENEGSEGGMIFRDSGTWEGENVIPLNDNIAKVIRIFSDKFLKTSPIEKVYGNALLEKDPSENIYLRDSINMEGIPHYNLPKHYTCYKEEELEKDPDLKEKVETNKRFDDILYSKIKELEKKVFDEVSQRHKKIFLKECAEENIVSEKVEVSYSSNELEDVGEFASRYIEPHESSYYSDYIFNERYEDTSSPYIIFYEDLLEDKGEILRYLDTHLAKRNYIFKAHKVNNFLRGENSLPIIYYEVGNAELNILHDHLKDRDENIFLLTDAIFLDAPRGNTREKFFYQIVYGRKAIIDRGQDLKDFISDFTGED